MLQLETKSSQIDSIRNRINQIYTTISELKLPEYGAIKRHFGFKILNNIIEKLTFIEDLYVAVIKYGYKELGKYSNLLRLGEYDRRGYLYVWEKDPYSTSPLMCESGFESEYHGTLYAHLQEVYFKSNILDLIEKDLSEIESKQTTLIEIIGATV
jgi:hypothetical protein